MTHEAFTLLVRRDRPALLRYARRMVGADGAEDVVQTALMRAWAQLDTGVAVLYQRTWLFTIVHNTALNVLKSPMRPMQLTVDLERAGADVADLYLEREETRRVMRAIATLSPRQREAIMLAASGVKPAEISAQMGISDGGGRMLLFRAREHLRAAG